MGERRRAPRPVGRAAVIAVALLLVSAAAPRARETSAQAAARTTYRLVFEARRGAVPQIYSVDPATRRNAQLTFARGGASNPLVAPDGRQVAYDQNPVDSPSEREVRVMRPDGSRSRLVARNAFLCGWTPDSRAVLYRDFGSATLMVRRLNGSAPHVYDELLGCPVWNRDGRASFRIVPPLSTLVLTRDAHQQAVASDVSSASWSPDGRRIAYSTRGTVTIALADGSVERTLEDRSYSYAWAPDSRRLAVVRGSGFSSRVAVYVVATATETDLAGATGATAVSWSPAGVIAYTTLGGTVRRVTAGAARPLAADQRYVAGLGWARNLPGARYRPRDRVRPVATRAAVRTRTPFGAIAADGRRAAFALCGEVGGWTAGTARLLPLQMSRLPCTELTVRVPSVAVAGERAAWATDIGGNVSGVRITVAAGSSRTVVATSLTSRGSPAGAGWLYGAGPLLVFGTSTLSFSCTEERCSQTWLSTVWRVRDPAWAGSCPVGEGQPGPCQRLAAYEGRAQPVAVDSARVAVRLPDDDLQVIDAEDGRPLSTLEAPGGGAWDADLGDGLLVVAVRGALRVLDSATGSEIKRLALPDGAPASDCGSRCGTDVLQLSGVARGLAAYVVGGRAYLRRLSDGAERDVGPATAARLTAAGLFSISEADDRWPGRLRFRASSKLPLR